MMEVEKPEWRPGTGICRCCLSDGCYKDISAEYFWQGEKEVYADMLLDTFDLTISYQDVGTLSNSRLICDACIARLRDATHFKKLVVDSENKFSQITAGKLAESLEAGTFKEVKVENIKGEMVIDDDDIDNVEYLEEHLDDDDEDNQPLQRFASNETKKEIDIDFSEELSVKKSANKTGKRKYTKKSVTAAKKSKSSKKEPTEEKPSGSKGSAKKGIDEMLAANAWKKSKTIANTTIKKIVPKSKSVEKVRKLPLLSETRKNAELILDCATVYPIRLLKYTLICVYCGEYFNEPALHRQHCNERHSNCDNCPVFAGIQRDEPIKVDISEMHCKICGMPFENIDLFVEHIETTHSKKFNKDFSLGVIPFDLRDSNFNCVVCKEKCSSIVQLNSHMGTHYQNYICDFCGKGFTLQTTLRQHVLQEHSTSHECRECQQTFNSFAEKKIHLKEHRSSRVPTNTRETTLCHPILSYKCKTCSLSFKTAGARSIHFRTVHSNETGFPCTQCDKRFTKRFHLNKHMRCHLDAMLSIKRQF